MPLISVILPIYNVEKYLSRCLHSVREQSLCDIEIVCVLDGSTDRSSAIVCGHASVDDRIKVIEKTNGGLSSARNVGINAASGEYLMFVDSDDYIERNACSVVYDAFCREGADIVTFGARCVPACNSNPWLDECLSPRDSVFTVFTPGLLFEENSRPYAWRTAVRKGFLVENDLFFSEKIDFGEDQVFHFEVYPLSRKTVLLSDKLYCYRVGRENSLMATFASDPEIRVNRHLAIVREISAIWMKRGLMGLYAKEFLDWTLDFLFLDIRDLPTDCRGDALREYSRIVGPLVTDAVLSELSPACGGVLRAVKESDEAALSSRLLFLQYYTFRFGRWAYVQDTIMRPLRACRSVVRRVLPPPAASVQSYFDDLDEKTKLEKDLLASFALLDLEIVRSAKGGD